MDRKDFTTIIDGLQVAYAERGSGRPILFLHGWGSSSDSWSGVADELSKSGFRVVILDLPGFGKTPPPPQAWGVGEYAAFVEKFGRALDIFPCVLAGHSFGGQVAVMLASLRPGLVSRLVLVAPAALRPAPGRKELMLQKAATMMRALLSIIPDDGAKEYVRRALYRAIGRYDYGRARGIMREVFKKVVRQDCATLLPAIRTQTLLLWGEKDALTPLAHGVRIRFPENLQNPSVHFCLHDRSFFRRHPFFNHPVLGNP
ncbi:MAG: alpha/beta fold hydrolase [Candidatus Wildermuthbacteria bacterium]|nr:alpha/beta fold hydrolase [Candidatus Wildermuthbacteria bacterium]